MVKEFEKAGFPVVHMCNLIPVSTTVGANRIVPTISIPYPLGDPNSPREEQWKLRYHRVGVALQAPVSYTHLDVYKRQAHATPQWPR